MLLYTPSRAPAPCCSSQHFPFQEESHPIFCVDPVLFVDSATVGVGHYGLSALRYCERSIFTLCVYVFCLHACMYHMCVVTAEARTGY